MLIQTAYHSYREATVHADLSCTQMTPTGVILTGSTQQTPLGPKTWAPCPRCAGPLVSALALQPGAATSWWMLSQRPGTAATPSWLVGQRGALAVLLRRVADEAGLGVTEAEPGRLCVTGRLPLDAVRVLSQLLLPCPLPAAAETLVAADPHRFGQLTQVLSRLVADPARPLPAFRGRALTSSELRGWAEDSWTIADAVTSPASPVPGAP